MQTFLAIMMFSSLQQYTVTAHFWVNCKQELPVAHSAYLVVPVSQNVNKNQLKKKKVCIPQCTTLNPQPHVNISHVPNLLSSSSKWLFQLNFVIFDGINQHVFDFTWLFDCSLLKTLHHPDKNLLICSWKHPVCGHNVWLLKRKQSKNTHTETST